MKSIQLFIRTSSGLLVTRDIRLPFKCFPYDLRVFYQALDPICEEIGNDRRVRIELDNTRCVGMTNDEMLVYSQLLEHRVAIDRAVRDLKRTRTGNHNGAIGHIRQALTQAWQDAYDNVYFWQH